MSILRTFLANDEDCTDSSLKPLHHVHCPAARQPHEVQHSGLHTTRTGFIHMGVGWICIAEGAACFTLWPWTPPSKGWGVPEPFFPCLNPPAPYLRTFWR